LWLERQYLQGRQQEFTTDIKGEETDGLARDAAIAQFMVLADDIESLNLAMDDLLKGAR